jgi:hypothetical protein
VCGHERLDEANRRRRREVEGDAYGPHVREMEKGSGSMGLTVSRAYEMMYSLRPIQRVTMSSVSVKAH